MHPDQPPTTTLWRPTGPKELDLVRELDWRAWPPRLPEQPIFYPVLNEVDEFNAHIVGRIELVHEFH
ncbi:hypothetical protein [Streptomyces swartbergensis]|uniref:Uncharacterized protein n=1 Tax=Streptomyces swartbergensis TaxID=487165 RepID=A0A243QH42_9ACTN|nr:hypothetical protein [Streptomyces swartbergensis]OUC81254.1 hypothetical protein CA983_42965 [Streptomyces swartbergensis]